MERIFLDGEELCGGNMLEMVQPQFKWKHSLDPATYRPKHDGRHIDSESAMTSIPSR